MYGNIQQQNILNKIKTKKIYIILISEIYVW